MSITVILPDNKRLKIKSTLNDLLSEVSLFTHFIRILLPNFPEYRIVIVINKYNILVNFDIYNNTISKEMDLDNSERIHIEEKKVKLILDIFESYKNLIYCYCVKKRS